jgi:hypothetical protein
LFSPQAYKLLIETPEHYFHIIVNDYIFRTAFNFNVALIKRETKDDTLNEEMIGIILIDSVSLSPPYLILLLILHPRTNSKKGALWTLCRNRYQTGQGTDPQKQKIKLFNTEKNHMLGAKP